MKVVLPICYVNNDEQGLGAAAQNVPNLIFPCGFAEKEPHITNSSLTTLLITCLPQHCWRIYISLYANIYCIFKNICATTPSTYDWPKNTSSNWNVQILTKALWKTTVLIPMCICIWVIGWSDKANKPLSLMNVPLRLHHIFSCWWSCYINPSNCKWRKRNHYWCNKCLASNIQRHPNGQIQGGHYCHHDINTLTSWKCESMY